MGLEPRPLDELEDETQPATEDIDAHQATIVSCSRVGELRGVESNGSKTTNDKVIVCML